MKLYYLTKKTGYINLRKIKWDAKHEHEYVQNFKVLQATFRVLLVDKVFIIIVNLGVLDMFLTKIIISKILSYF